MPDRHFPSNKNRRPDRAAIFNYGMGADFAGGYGIRPTIHQSSRLNFFLNEGSRSEPTTIFNYPLL